MINIFQEIIQRLSGFREIADALDSGSTPVLAVGVSPVHKAQLSLGLYSGAPLLIITDDEANASRLCNDINEMARRNTAYLYPAKDMTLANVEGVSREYEHIRLATLSALVSGEAGFVVAGTEAAMQLTIPPFELSKRTLVLKNGDSVDLEELSRKLISSGYSRSDRTDGVSQFSVRGSVVDIFPVGAAFPVRMELWGDEIDSMSFFDTETQRRTSSVDEVRIPPALETLF